MFNKLDNEIREWYETTDESNTIAAMEIGYRVLNTSNYLNNKDKILTDLTKKLDKSYNELNKLKDDTREKLERKDIEYDNKLILERSKIEDLKKDNNVAIDVGIKCGIKYIEQENTTLHDYNTQIKTEKKDLQEELLQLTNKLHSLECSIKISKTKGDMSEQNIKNLIEEIGYKAIKPGIHSGDLVVYSSNSDTPLCVLEIKNYGDDNKHKLGPNGSETKKMYNDIKKQLKTYGDIPWLFISLGCEIPHIEELVPEYLGVKCFYLSLPSENELMGYIKCIEVIVELGKNDENEDNIHMELKLHDMNNILNKLVSSKIDFKTMNELITKLKDKLEKEEIKYNKQIEDSVKLSTRIMNKIQVNVKEDTKLNVEINSMSFGEIQNYIKSLQVECVRKREKIKCDICGKEVMDLSTHKKTKSCKKNAI